MSYVIYGLPENTIYSAWFTSKVNVYHNWLIIRVLYNNGMEYKATRVWKGLKKGQV